MHHKVLNIIQQRLHLHIGDETMPLHPQPQIQLGEGPLHQVENISLGILYTSCLTCIQAQPILQDCKLFLKFLAPLYLGGNLPLHFLHPTNFLPDKGPNEKCADFIRW